MCTPFRFLADGAGAELTFADHALGAKALKVSNLQTYEGRKI